MKATEIKTGAKSRTWGRRGRTNHAYLNSISIDILVCDACVSPPQDSRPQAT